VALARFTIFVVPARGRPGRPLRGDDLLDGDLSLSWRLLAANNRDVARSAEHFPDLAACLDGIRTLRANITAAAAVASRSGRADWSWRLRVAGADLAVSSRTYQRRLQCEAACALFMSLVPDAVIDDWPATPPRRPASTVTTILTPTGVVEPDDRGELPAALLRVVASGNEKPDIFRP
jgi:uncharacterized protein YegP (UPF0339 family)